MKEKKQNSDQQPGRIDLNPAKSHKGEPGCTTEVSVTPPVEMTVAPENITMAVYEKLWLEALNQAAPQRNRLHQMTDNDVHWGKLGH